MKITKTETVTTDVEISLPHYRTDNICHVYKVYSEMECVRVCHEGDWLGIEHVPTLETAFGKDTVESTEEEFLLKFDEVYHNLLKL